MFLFGPTQTTRVSMRLLVVVLATLVWLTSAAQVWAMDWNDVPFPSEVVKSVEGDETHFLAHDSDPDEHQLIVDGEGDHWAVTNRSVYRLPKGGGAWIEEVAGVDFPTTDSHGLGGSTIYYDADVQKVFLFSGYGSFVRSADDAAWRQMNDTGVGGPHSGYAIVKFAGYLWEVAFGGVLRIDPQTETVAIADTRGLPSVGFDTKEQLANLVVTDSALYVSVIYVYEDGVQPPDFNATRVYRLDSPDGPWVDAGLTVTPLDSELRPWSSGRPEWGIRALHATQGFVFASVSGSNFQANRLFVLDEAKDAWSQVPLPPEEPVIDNESGEAQYLSLYIAPYDVLPVWDARLYSYDRAEYPNGGDVGAQVRFSVFDPRLGTWQADITKPAIAWTPAIPDDIYYLGDQIVVSRRYDDYLADAPASPGFVASVPLPTQVSTDPEVIGTNAIMALFFAITFGAISSLFNSTLKGNYASVASWFSPLKRLVGRTRAALARPRNDDGTGSVGGTFAGIVDRIPTKRVWQPLAIVLVSALVYGFLDPEFGPTVEGLGLLLSLALAIGVTTFAYEGLQSVLSSRRFGAPARMRLFPAAIAIAVACVAISRVMGFHPGYVFGIVGGLAFATTVEPDSKSYGRMVLISAGALLAVSFIAWFAAVPVAAAVESDGGFLLTTLQAGLISMFVMGLEALLFGLLPLGFMDGEKVLRWNKFAWVAAFGTVAFAFWHVLLNPNSKYLDSFGQKNVVLMFGLLAGYGLVTVAMFLYFRARSRRAAPSATAG
jgi:hypothetical protein